MKRSIKTMAIALILTMLLVGLNSCQKEDIAPANQSVAFIKYYGHVSNQTGADLISTADGGFLMVGSTNSYTSRDESDGLVVKTDSLGNEQWSIILAKAPDNRLQIATGDPLDGFYIRYDEVGKKAIEMPDGSGYVIGVERTYVTFDNISSTTGVRRQTKVVLYSMGLDGSIASTDGVELRPNGDATYSQSINGIVADTASSIVKYIIVGATTNVGPKPGDPIQHAVTDKTDLFISRLASDFTLDWVGRGNAGASRAGFQGTDYGVSIHVTPYGYMLCGIVDRNRASSGNSQYEFFPTLAAIVYDKSSGTITSALYYGARGYEFDFGSSTYNSSTDILTLWGHVSIDSDNETGKLALLKIDLPTVQNGAAEVVDDIVFYDVAGTASEDTPYKAVSINELPNNEGYITSSTFEKSGLESNVCIMKINSDLTIDTGRPYYFGDDDPSATFATQDQAGTILPLVNNIGTTSRVELTGYAFTGAFGLGTNSMMGLIKLNANGTFEPQ